MIPDEETLNRLKVTPAMYLGSCRHKLPDFFIPEMTPARLALIAAVGPPDCATIQFD